MPETNAYAAAAAHAALAPATIPRRDPRPDDVVIAIDFCGICHSDIHQVREEWGGALFPMVPGHEIVGRVTAVGAQVRKFKIGDRAGVGCMVDSCGVCASCREGLEQFCEEGCTLTYNALDRRGEPTYGGYSKSIVVKEAFALKIPEALASAGAAPLLCAGITTYSPMRHWQVGPGKKVGVVGLGGLGHMALKFAHALGATVVQFTHSPGKAADARRLGADAVVVSSDPDAMRAHTRSFDFILDTVGATHDLNALLGMLKRDATLALVGAPEKPHAIAAFNLILGRRSLAGSAIGGIAETQEMLDFCAAHGLASDIETIPMAQVNHAYDRVLKNDVKYRFVLDLATL